MPKAPRSVTKRRTHKKWIKRAKGYRGRRQTVYKIAKAAVITAGQHAYHDRRKKKANFRQLWQIQINAAVRQHGLTYSRFVYRLRQANVAVDRKILAILSIKHPEVFGRIVSHVQDRKTINKSGP